MTDLPAPLSPSNPLGAPRKPGARNGDASKPAHSIDWKSAKLIHAMLAGIEEPIEDNVAGLIPAHTPLRLEQAARAVNMRLRRARALRMTPEFCEAMRQATANYRACLEPGNIQTALEIRDDKLVKPRDRLHAAEFLQGPKEARGLTVNVSTQNINPGYVIRLDRKEEIPGTRIDHEAETIPALPSSENAAGGMSRDIDKERLEQEQPRIIRP